MNTLRCSFRVAQLRSGLVRVAVAFAVVLQGSCATHPTPVGTTTPSGPSAPKGLPESFRSGRETVAVFWSPAFDPKYIPIPSPKSKGTQGAGNALSNLWGSCLQVGVPIFFMPYLIGVIPGAAILAGCTVATPFLAIDGAVRGSATLSGKELQLANGPLRATLSEMINDDALIETVLLTARDQTLHTLRPRSWTDRDKVPRSKGLTANLWGPSEKSFRYEAVAREGIDTALNLEVEPVFTLGEGVDPPLSLRVEARARLISVRDGTELYNETFAFCCESHTRAGWAADYGHLLRTFFTNAYPSLGERIANEIFVTYPIDEGRGAEQSVAFGLRLKYPSLKEGLGYLEVSSAQPTLEWESLLDLKIPPGGVLRCPVTVAGHCDSGQLISENQETELRPMLERTRDVTYELRVAEIRQGQAPKFVYTRAGLTTPRHPLAVPLEAGAVYLWSVRAHFELDGHRRVTAWGYQKLRRERDSTDSTDAAGANQASPYPRPSPTEEFVNCAVGGERQWTYQSKCD